MVIDASRQRKNNSECVCRPLRPTDRLYDKSTDIRDLRRYCRRCNVACLRLKKVVIACRKKNNNDVLSLLLLQRQTQLQQQHENIFTQQQTIYGQSRQYCCICWFVVCCGCCCFDDLKWAFFSFFLLSCSLLEISLFLL